MIGENPLAFHSNAIEFTNNLEAIISESTKAHNAKFPKPEPPIDFEI